MEEEKDPPRSVDPKQTTEKGKWHKGSGSFRDISWDNSQEEVPNSRGTSFAPQNVTQFRSKLLTERRPAPFVVMHTNRRYNR